MINWFFFLVLFLNCFLVKSQVIITEIYYNSPFLEDVYHYSNLREDNPNPFYTHLGEYIELYNYTTEPISLKGWSITDNVSRFNFPNTAVIQSQQFIVIAYKGSATGLGSNYFTTFFPNTVGQETQIFYQDKMMLNNNGDVLRLNLGSVRGTMIKEYTIQTKEFGSVNDQNANNWQEQDGPINLSEYNFYTSSIHLINSSNSFTTGTATPLSESYVPPTQNLEEIQQVQDAMYADSASLTWDTFSNEILANTCPVNISNVEQVPVDNYLSNGKCYTYDDSGNSTTSLDCTPVAIPPNAITEYSPEEIEDFYAHIVLYPNPTSTTLLASWDGSVVGKITQMQVATSGGTILTNDSINSTQNSSNIDLTSQPTGIYIVRFLLNSGQFISKNVIKI